MTQVQLLPRRSAWLNTLPPSFSLRPRSRCYATLQPRKSLPRRMIQGAAMFTLGTTVVVGVGGALLYKTNDQFRHVANALERCRIAGTVGAQVAYDYHTTLSKHYSTPAEHEEAKRACHQRSATRVLKAIQHLGGVYVKLGQHISVMQYLLPDEWCLTMRVLQDQCVPTSPEAIRALFRSDMGMDVGEIFEAFDWTPLGVASLAQVHRARLSQQSIETLKQQRENSWLDDDTNDRWVAVKLQHPYLDEYCQLDMDTVSFIFEIVKRVFPDFGFDWFAEEMRESIPKELDFVHESQNSNRVRSNFAEDVQHNKTALVIPQVIWAKRRIMCMEFINGSRVDDLEYMKKHNIDPRQVSNELTRVFSEMIFLHGFVHCDPHPGNVFIRPAKNPKYSKYNFDLVLLDHGLYRELSDDLRSNYAHLWTSLIKADEEGIQKYAYRVGGTDIYQLFACMLTGREWEKISQSDLGSTRGTDEVGRISEGALTYLVQVADILARLPRPVLLLLKTNDLLRHVDEKLNSVSDERITYMVMGMYCSKAVWLDTKKYIFEKIKSVGFNLHLFKELIKAWWQYESLSYLLWIYQFSFKLTEKLFHHRQ
ncbi:ABC1 family-domain-containing protein [Gilbertella persicaria]|uniref:ABC1 family-domain-containing protein n=1 Tax=Gilbertella persicaria TaxID=101096 RepID=UPI00221F1724|nr:ABC1 family-domain-containing protein [Gilbertella persicaria]KAI8082619.1 ABC1 family-domain-containing protein [Gilbertella persicaria]